MRLKRQADAEKTLRRVVQLAPGDAESLLALERVLVQQQNLRDAIEVLAKLVQADPKRAREFYQRMAQYAAELYRDDDAISYAARAVELSPDDADGHKKLGEMYRRRQDRERAIQSFRQAISKNDRLFPVYFELAELLLGRGDHDEADKLLRRVLRASPDEELVAQAARLSMQINLGRGTLESLEKELLPVALGNPTKPLYRRLLVEIYGAMTFPLVQTARSSDKAEADRARTELRRIGERAVKPLLDALGDERDTQQRIAIELLAHVENSSAGPALFAYATGNADTELRVRAMVAVGALSDSSLLPRLKEVLFSEGKPRGDEADPVVVAAAWAAARMRSQKARELLLGLLTSEAPSVRALGALGLGLLADRRSSAELAKVVRSIEAGPVPRAAAALALAEIGDSSATEPLTQLLEASDPALRASALVALARLEAPSSDRAAAEALVSPEPALQAAGVSAALVLATREHRASRRAFEPPDGRVDVRQLLERLLPTNYTPDEHARALERLAPALARACVAAAQSSPEGARTVAEALLARDGKPAFGPLTRDIERSSPALKKKAEQGAELVAAAVVGPFVALSSHPSAEIRQLSVRLLGTRPDAAARKRVILALEDRDEHVQRTALTGLAALGAPHRADAIDAIVALLVGRSDWPVRVRAAEALGELAKGSKNPKAVAALSQASQKDAYALVREASLRALFAVDEAAARPVLKQAGDKDGEPRVRELARALSKGR